MTVPDTIHDIIAARIDRLDESAQADAPGRCGRRPRDSVSPCCPRVRESRARSRGGSTCSELHAVDFVFPSAHEPEPMYSFKHALTQDVVYAQPPGAAPPRYHARGGHAASRSSTPGGLDEVVELLAYHFGRSGEDEKAVDYAILAAEKAQRRWANTEALAQFEARSSDSRRCRTRRRTGFAASTRSSSRRRSSSRSAVTPSTSKALEAIRDVVEAAADPPRRAAWYYWTGFLHSLAGARPEVPIAYCREASAIADANGLDEIRRIAECCLTHVNVRGGQSPGGSRGRGARARDLRGARERVVGVPDAVGHQHGRERLGQWARSLECLPPGARAWEGR